MKTLQDRWEDWRDQCAAAIRRMQELETENNRLFINAYGLADELKPDVPEDQITLARADARKDMAAFLSYAVGCMMGRYSLDQPGLILANAGDTVREYLAKVGNLMEFLQMTHALVSEGDEVAVHLVTKSDAESCVKQEEFLTQMMDAFSGSRVAFSWEFDHSANFHARSIMTDTGWKITIDRGLDIFQRYESGPFSLEQAVQETRLTRGAEITYLKV